jgi:uncharacterized cupredoxin-like copper-binding protein
MSTTLEREDEQSLSDELRELEAQEEALERRTRSLELAGPLALIFSLVALAVGIGAIAIALSNGSDNASGSGSTGAGAGGAAGTMMGSSASTGTTMGSNGRMMGAGGHGSFTSAMVAAAAHGKIYVQLGDYWAAPTVSSVRAGKVTFIARNVGKVPHELMVERMPVKFDSPMHPNEDAAQGIIDNMDPGQSGRMTMRLRPGTYMLFCNAPGHYAAGQHTLFTATKS